MEDDFDDDFLSSEDQQADNPNGAPRYRFKLVPFDKIRPGSGASYLVSRLIPAQGLIVIWGPPKCGKSFWILDLIFHIALGWYYRGHRVKQGRVVYICCEGEFAIPFRIEAFRQNKLAETTDNIPFELLPTRLRLPADLNELILDLKGQLGNNRPAIIVIDTLNRSIDGSESSDEDMGKYIKALDQLRDTFKCAVAVVHHCGINENRPRGHTSLRGASDAEISVRRDVQEHVITSVEFMKDGPADCLTASILTPVIIDTNDDGDPITSCFVEETIVDKQSRRKTPRLSPAQGRAYQLLAEAIEKAGEVPPSNTHIPENVRCTREDLWREYCYKGSVSQASQDAKQKAFKRASAQLLAADRIGKWEPWVWIK